MSKSTIVSYYLITIFFFFRHSVSFLLLLQVEQRKRMSGILPFSLISFIRVYSAFSSFILPYLLYYLIFLYLFHSKIEAMSKFSSSFVLLNLLTISFSISLTPLSYLLSLNFLYLYRHPSYSSVILIRPLFPSFAHLPLPLVALYSPRDSTSTASPR